MLRQAQVWQSAGRIETAFYIASQSLKLLQHQIEEGRIGNNRRLPSWTHAHIKAHLLLLGAEVHLSTGNMDEAQKCVTIAAGCAGHFPFAKAHVLQAICGLRTAEDALKEVTGRLHAAQGAGPQQGSMPRHLALEADGMPHEEAASHEAPDLQAEESALPVPVIQEAAPTHVVSDAAVRHSLLQMVTDIAQDSVELDSPLMGAGVDSLSSLQLSNLIKKEFSIRVPPTLVFEHPTVAEIADFVVEELKNAS